MRLIDADALLEITERHTPVFDENTKAMKVWFTALLKSELLTPTVEQKHGTWNILTQDWDGCLVQCSECGSIDTALYPYCHKCGSIMYSKLVGEGEEDDDRHQDAWF